VIVPIIFTAPLYLSGDITIGAVTQSVGAFGKVLGVVALVVDKIETFSIFSAGLQRLNELREALDDSWATQQRQESLKDEELEDAASRKKFYLDYYVRDPKFEPRIEGFIKIETYSKFNDQDLALELENIQLLTPPSSVTGKTRVLVDGLNLKLRKGESLMVMGSSGNGKSSLLRCIAGLWRKGTGVIRRPSLSRMLFLPQRPYLISGSLKDNLLYPRKSSLSRTPLSSPTTKRKKKSQQRSEETKERDVFEEILRQVNLLHVAEKIGGYDVPLENIAHVLSIGEQQRLAFGRIFLHKPPFVLLDESTSALDEENERKLYEQLHSLGCTVVSVGHRSTLRKFHEQMLVLRDDGTCRTGSRDDDNLFD